MDDRLDAILTEHKGLLYKDLEKLVNINSFTTNLKGVEDAKEALIEMSKSVDVKLKTVFSSKKVRPHLMHGKDLDKNYYAFIGHFDTVHAPSSSFNTFSDEGETLKGPGINDMKAGVIVALHSVAILQKYYKTDDLPIKILFNSDEEVGSYDSEELLKTEFSNAKAGFIFEPGRPNGEIVTHRKGIASLDIEVTGKAAHSGVAPWEGVNALLASCKLIQKLEKLNDYNNGIIVGCNQINAGVARNVVPAKSNIVVDVRFQTMKQQSNLFQSLEEILKASNTDGITVKYQLTLNRPPLEQNQRSKELASMYQSTAEKLGYVCGEVSTGGGSDGNFLAAMGIPTVDGLGAVGNYSHTTKEFIYKESLFYRTKIFVKFMKRLFEENHDISID